MGAAIITLSLLAAVVIAFVALLRLRRSRGPQPMASERVDQTEVEREVYEKIYGPRSNGHSQARRVDSSRPRKARPRKAQPRARS